MEFENTSVLEQIVETNNEKQINHQLNYATIISTGNFV